MSQGLLPYTVETVDRADTVTGRAGLPLGLETMRARGLDQAIAAHLHVRERQSGCTEAAKLEALVLLLAAGGGTVSTTSGSSRPMRGSPGSWTGRSPRPIRCATSCTRSMPTRCSCKRRFETPPCGSAVAPSVFSPVG